PGRPVREGPSMTSRTRALARAFLLCAAPLLLAACTDFFHDSAPPEPVLLSLVSSFDVGGPFPNPALAPAFDQTNRVRVRVESESTGALLLEQELEANP